MIVSASRRTDIPALYAPWLQRRLSEGFADVASPFDARRVRRVCLKPPPDGDLDALVLWTRDPAPLLPAVPAWESGSVRTLWLVTLTGYPRALEPNGPLAAAALEGVRALARAVGPDRVAWRYDPLFLCPEAGLTSDWHRRNFASLARALRGSASRCVVSLCDDYAKSRKRLRASGLSPLTGPEAQEAGLTLVRDLAEEAAKNGLRLQSCCEDLASAGVPAGGCIDGQWLDQLWGLGAAGQPDPGQRTGCRCALSVDVGAYDTCTHGCLYCYATGSPARAADRRAAHRPDGERLA